MLEHHSVVMMPVLLVGNRFSSCIFGAGLCCCMATLPGMWNMGCRYSALTSWLEKSLQVSVLMIVDFGAGEGYGL